MRTLQLWMAGTAVVSVALLPWAPSGCAGAHDRSALAVDATANSPAPTSCGPAHAACSTDDMCCSRLCVNAACADPRPPPPGPWCPAFPPRAGDFCTVNGVLVADGVTCEYGNSPVRMCNETYTCESERWVGMAPDAGDPACAPNAAFCPDSWTNIPVGGPCASPNMHCDYSGARCECAQNVPMPGWPATWRCPTAGDLDLALPDGGWELLGACPQPRPRLGTACHQLGAACDYGVCQIRGGNGQTCASVGPQRSDGLGVWVEEPIDCSCPATQPDAGDPCSWNPRCEYGSSPVAQCNTLATCAFYGALGPFPLGRWSLVVPDAGAPCAPAPAGECPSSEPMEGTPCATPSLDCDYGGSRCECTAGPSRQSTATTWRCTDPQLAGAGCGARPHLGTSCPRDELSCNYGACEIAGGIGEICDRGVWIEQSLPPCASCPASAPEAGAPCAPGAGSPTTGSE